MARPKKTEQATVEAVEPKESTTVIEVIEDIVVPAKPGVYLVAWAIKTGGKRYATGDTVELTDEQAAPFLASGAITEA
jgi:uncharacterized membrane protein